jgi:hypothetical protein
MQISFWLKRFPLATDKRPLLLNHLSALFCTRTVPLLVLVLVCFRNHLPKLFILEKPLLLLRHVPIALNIHFHELFDRTVIPLSFIVLVLPLFPKLLSLHLALLNGLFRPLPEHTLKLLGRGILHFFGQQRVGVDQETMLEA